MNRAEKEAYLKDYAQAKAQGKPFFPYAIYKDHVVAVLVIGLVILAAIVWRVEVGDPVNPASTDFVPRPEWYFFFLFELLKIFEGENAFTPVIMATFIVPNILMVLLIALPFIDRGPERRPEKRPIAMATAVLVVAGLAWLTHEGANAPSGTVGGTIELTNLDEQGQAGLVVFQENNCATCHMIKGQGNTGPGPDLTNEGAKGRGIQWQIDHLKDPQSRTPGSSMPAFAGLTDQEYQDIAVFLEGLGTTYK